MRTIEKRIIVLEIKDEYILGDGVSVGAQGSHDDAVLRMEFSSAWSDTTKRVEWINALGESVGVTIITPLMLHKENVYDVAVPAAVKEHGGEITLTVQGVIIDEVTGVETVKITTEEAHFRVLKSFSGITEQDDVMPSQAEQLQAEIDGIDERLGGILEASQLAQQKVQEASAFKESAENAKNSAWDSEQKANEYMQKAEAAADSANSAVGVALQIKERVIENAERAEAAAERAENAEGGSQVDLSEYVKNTDYATTQKAGVVKALGGTYGIESTPDGSLKTTPATPEDIIAKTLQRKPIVPATVDLAVKTGMTTNALEWTDEEKANARTLIGAAPSTSPTAGTLKAWVSNGVDGYWATVQSNAASAASGFIAQYCRSTDGDTAVRGYMLTNVPTRAYHAANKKYVDDNFANVLYSQKNNCGAVFFDDLHPFTSQLDGIKLKSKNLLPAVTPGNYNGIEVTLTDDGGICLNGQVETGKIGASIKIILNPDDFKEGGNFVFTVRKNKDFPENNSMPGLFYLDLYGCYNNADENVIAIPQGYTPDPSMCYFLFDIFEGVVYDDFIMYPQIEKGTKATPFAPYVTDFTKVNLNKVGKQLFDGANMKITSLNGFEDEYMIPTYTQSHWNGAHHVQFGNSITDPTLAGIVYIDTLGLDSISVSFSRDMDYGPDSANYKFYLFNELDENGYVKNPKTTEAKQITTNDIIVETVDTKGYKYIGISAWCAPGAGLNNVMFSGASDGECEDYVAPTSYPADENGIVNGVIPNERFTTLYCDGGAVIKELKYNRDTNKVIEELFNKIAELSAQIV